MNKFLLTENKFLPEMYLRQQAFTYCVRELFSTTKKEWKTSKKQEIQDIFVKTNETRVAFNWAWLMKILNVYLKE